MSIIKFMNLFKNIVNNRNILNTFEYYFAIVMSNNCKIDGIDNNYLNIICDEKSLVIKIYDNGFSIKYEDNELIHSIIVNNFSMYKSDNIDKYISYENSKVYKNGNKNIVKKVYKNDSLIKRSDYYYDNSNGIINNTKRNYYIFGKMCYLKVDISDLRNNNSFTTSYASSNSVVDNEHFSMYKNDSLIMKYISDIGLEDFDNIINKSRIRKK